MSKVDWRRTLRKHLDVKEPTSCKSIDDLIMGFVESHPALYIHDGELTHAEIEEFLKEIGGK